MPSSFSGQNSPKQAILGQKAMKICENLPKLSPKRSKNVTRKFEPKNATQSTELILLSGEKGLYVIKMTYRAQSVKISKTAPPRDKNYQNVLKMNFKKSRLTFS